MVFFLTLLSCQVSISNSNSTEKNRMELKLNNQKTHRWLIILAVVLLMLAVALSVMSYLRNHRHAIAQQIAAEEQALQPKIQYQQTSVVVKPYDTLTKIFKRLNLDLANVRAILALKDAQSLRHLTPKQEMLFLLESNGKLHQISYQIDQTTVLTITNADGFKAHITKLKLEGKLEYLSVPVQSSVTASAKQAGLSRRLTTQLINIFNEKINFNRGSRTGDQFAVLYKNYYVNDKRVGEGDIEAAEFVHNNQSYRAVKFTDSAGHSDYYTPEGATLKSPFIRYPLDRPKVTSRFSLHRWHPILQMFCAHLGVDLSAPVGTPVKATSNGKIAFAGIKANYGKTVIIQHGQYSTLYAHLNGFAQGVKTGVNVARGQVIGRLGETGLATGPHVHYEFRIGNTHYDPLKVKLPAGEMIASAYRKQFLATAAQLFAKLDSKNDSIFALQSMPEQGGPKKNS